MAAERVTSLNIIQRYKNVHFWRVQSKKKKKPTWLENKHNRPGNFHGRLFHWDGFSPLQKPGDFPRIGWECVFIGNKWDWFVVECCWVDFLTLFFRYIIYRYRKLELFRNNLSVVRLMTCSILASVYSQFLTVCENCSRGSCPVVNILYRETIILVVTIHN